jgi:signal transduction histidine kinase
MLYERVSQLEQVKSDMIRIAAHDLKNPLGVVSAYLQMLIEPSPRPLNPHDVYPTVRRSTERMMQIIEDFLSLDRIEKAAERQTMEPFDLCQVVARAVDEFTSRAAMKSQQLDSSVPDDTCIVNGDAVQIYEAVTNFIGNAIKYTPENGVIAVSLEFDDQHARFEVRDNGYGVPEAQQEKLFQPFFRAKTGETARIEGTGLGLHLTKNIIERQGGSIIFHSVYGQGSTFGFQLPLYQPRAEEQLKQVDDAP